MKSKLAKNSLKLTRIIKKVNEPQTRVDSRKTKPTYVTVNLLKTKYKEKISKAATMRLIVYLPTETKG